MLLLIGLCACGGPVVQDSEVTPAAYEKPDSVDQRAYRAMTRGDYKTGIRLYERIIAMDPDNAVALYHLGYAYGQMGDRNREVLLYEKAILLGYASDQIFHNLGEAYLGLSQIEKSIEAFKQGLALNSKSADNHFGLAKAFQERLNFDQAEQELLATVRLEPEVIEFREFLGLFYLERGQPHKAAEQFEHILEINPDHEGAREFLKHIIEEDASKKKALPGVGGQ
jgi:tetratricopeptide (TPR) repeat protein